MIQIIPAAAFDPRAFHDETVRHADVDARVSEILSDIRANGDDALRRYTARFDGADIDRAEIDPAEIDRAFEAAEPEFRTTLRMAADNIRAFHEKQVRHGFAVTEKEGVVLGQRVTPLQTVGLYVPGGTAAYPSSVLMDAIPAKIAGVPEIILSTPPAKDGTVNPAILAAAKVAGVTRVFRMGGAQAVAAMAYGTASVPRVDKIVGPGNVYVATAKRMVYGLVDIDMIAGPSEILIVADDQCDPVLVAADMLSQAEHDRLASAVLLTPSRSLAEAVRDELERQIPLLPRADICRESIDRFGRIVITAGITEAVEIANRVAPEHLELCVDDPFALLPAVRNAGSVFLGRHVPEALGDYFAGPNHTLPTGGTARFSSPLSVDDFVKKSSFIYYSKAALAEVAPRIADFARREGLTAHARSVEVRGERG